MLKLSKKSSVTLVELPPTQFGKLNGDVSSDIYSSFRLPSRAIHVLEGVLRNDGWENVKSINPIYHGKKGKLTKENFKRIFDSDVLGISSITRTSKQSLELAEIFKSKNPEGIVIAGGPDPTVRTGDWLRHVDIVVRGEGEKTISELMLRLMENPEKLMDIEGLAFKKNNKTITTRPRKLLSEDELNKLPHPYYDKEVREKVTAAVIETSRGCPNDCEFCGVSQFYGRKYRIKSISYIIEGLKRIKNMGRTLFFTDDNFAANSRRTIKLLKEMSKKSLNKKIGIAQVTINVSENPELLKSLKEANVRGLCIGIESISNSSLKDIGKPYNAEMNIRGVEKLKKEDFWIHGMMMPGGDGDTPQTLKTTSEWINKNLNSVQLFPIGPLPGTRFYDRMEREKRILSKNWSLYDGNHVLLRPKNFTPYELQKTVNRMFKNFYSCKNSIKRLVNSPSRKLTLVLFSYNKFQGIRKMLYDPESKKHLKFLKNVN
ncbi:radical SAM protein [Candidatus Pacearchaeota archaeon]|nr:radical SAM protein [Candidatus Pacearchaeota archaeon]MBD3283629.1 radical SAM protein [Candidatus Pacearchaeota archaeon]